MNKIDAVTIIRSLLSSTNSSCSVYNLNKDFKNETGIDIPLFGYGSLSDFLHSIPETVRLTGVYPIQKVSLVENEKSAHIVSLVKRQKADKYQNMNYSKRFNAMKKKNNNRSKEFIEPKFFRKRQNSDGAKDENCHKIQTVPQRKQPSTSSDTSLPSSNECFSSDDTLSVADKIPAIDLSLHAESGKYIEVCPCHILSPHNFYLHFRRNKKKLLRFMDELQNFYTSEGEKFRMSEDARKPKQICAALHKGPLKGNHWYRSEVIEVVDDSQVIVRFIDYGMTTKIFNSHLRFLHRNFSLLPRQAVLSSLANICPAQGEFGWTASSKKRFRELAFEKDLIAGVVDQDTKTCSLRVALSSTSGMEMHINDTLVKEGYAVFERKVLHVNLETEANDFKSSTPKKNEAIESASVMESCEEDTRNFGRTLPRNGDPPKSPVPIFFSPDYSSNNSRLKKMLFG